MARPETIRHKGIKGIDYIYDMNSHHLNTWLQEFPKLAYLLNKEDKSILDKIDPLQYQYFNLTQETEVIRIINDHKPQAWKWERLFPALKDLSPEDHVILDHIVPNEYLGEVTEADVRRIIEYRKSETRKEKENSEAFKAKQYYQDHKDEIEQEEKTRDRITKVVKYTSLTGVSFLTASVVLKSGLHACIGGGLIVLPLLITAFRLKELDRNSVIPRPIKKMDGKLDFLSIAFIVLYYIGFIGMGITLGMFLVWELAGWYTAREVMMTGLSTIGVSVILFLITAIATPSKD